MIRHKSIKFNICNCVAALLCVTLAGCNLNEGGYQSAESGSTTAKPVIEGIPAPIEGGTEAQKPLPPIDSIEVLGDCFVAPDPKANSELVEFFDSYDCEPGYVYFEKETFGRVALLLDKKCKSVAPHDWYQNEEYFWTVSEENEIIKVNKRESTYEVLFALDAPDGDIYRFEHTTSADSSYKNGRLMYFAYTDGYHDHLVILERDTDKYEILRFNEGLKGFYPAGWQESMKEMGVNDEPYICDVCGYTGNYVIWENNYNEFFWYHPETGENTPLKLSKNTGNAAVFILAEQD